jgi:hypothetical protein
MWSLLLADTADQQSWLTVVWDNKEWLFSGIGVVMLLAVFGMIKWGLPRFFGGRRTTSAPHAATKPEYCKEKVHILFIDDDTSFRVTEILRQSGWVNTHIIPDLDTLDQADLRVAEIVFVDIQGVGVKLGFHDGGLGLVQAIKDRYPQKHVIVYSAETRGNRFHQGLKAADDFLPKNAEPYEFQKIVEDFVRGSSS